MSTFNGVDLLLLLSLMGMALLAMFWRGYALLLERQVDAHGPYCHTEWQRPSQSAEPYDWAKDGL